ncbi:hypothetical protein SHJG_7970 [Streptomyces hygroscopicus subsp. jinggangensis 5008]|nr:hypothetical protein SHJG_7970 [Streptomyces hygroscopicus subsp. jinggangensis 5008]AGF67394.1 hypothetical protein SHJGH_7732 [Streptomyces hygroscopicus subsp. jinggangensis TL01]
MPGLRPQGKSTAHAYTNTVIHLLAQRTPDLLKVRRKAEPDFIRLVGTWPSATGSAPHAPTTPTSTAGTE